MRRSISPKALFYVALGDFFMRRNVREMVACLICPAPAALPPPTP